MQSAYKKGHAHMRHLNILTAAFLVATIGFAVAQTANKGLTPGKGNPDQAGTSKSGSGTSTSGGKDATGDRGRDAMPDSNINVKPLDQQNRNQNGSPK